MKKLVSLIMVLAMVLGLATVAFANSSATVLTPVEDAGAWSVQYNQPGTYSITLPANCNSVYVQFVGMNSMAMNGYNVNISSVDSSNQVNNDYSVQYGRMPVMVDMGGNATLSLSMMGGFDFTLNGEAGDVFTLEFAAPPVGTYDTPDEISGFDSYFTYSSNANSEVIQGDECVFEFTVMPPADDTYHGEYYYNLIPYNGPYYMTISNVEAGIPRGQAVAGAELDWSVSLNTDYGFVDVCAAEPEETEATVGMSGASLQVVAGQYNEDGELVGPAAIKFTISYEYPDEGTELAPYEESFDETPDIFRTCTIADSELVEDNFYGLEYTYFRIVNSPSWGCKLTIADKDAVIKYFGEFYTADNDDDNDDSVLTVNLSWDSDTWMIGIANIGSEDKRFDVECDLLDGYFANPFDLVIGENKVSFDEHYDDFEVDYDENYYSEYYYYEWTATEAGTLSISDLIAVIPENMLDYYPEDAEASASYKWALNVETATEDPTIEGESVHVVKGDVVTVWVCVEYDADLWCNPAADVTFTASFLSDADVAAAAAAEDKIEAIGNVTVDSKAAIEAAEAAYKALSDAAKALVSKDAVTALSAARAAYDALVTPGAVGNPIEIEIAGSLSAIDVKAGETVYYAINSKLNGQILTIKVDGNATVTLNGKELKAENGVVTAVLDKTPVNALTVANKGEKAASYVASINWPVGSESNPIVIESATDLTGIDAAKGESVCYAINSKLNGQILTIAVDSKTVVTLNGKEVKAENGIVTVALDGTPVNALVVTNKGDKDASYTASIAYALGTAGNPIAVNSEKELNGVKVAAGEEVHYLLNSKLEGAVLSVKGDKAYVIVNGEKTEAKDGIIKLTLAAKGATISLVVGGEATVTLGYSDNPNTGDAGIMAPIATLLVSAMSTVALVIKKKEF